MPPILRTLTGGRVDIEGQSGYGAHWDAGSGESWVKTWTGSRQQMYDRMQGLKLDHDSVDLTPGKTDEDWTLTARITDSTTRVDQWDLQATQLQQSVFTSSRVLAALGTTQNLNTVRGAAQSVKNAAGGDQADKAYTKAITEINSKITDPTYNENAHELFQLLIKDTDSIINWSYYFTHTISLSRWDDTTIVDFSKVKKIFNRTQLVAATLFDDPVENIPDIEWLMEAPSDMIVLGQRRQITYRWVGADTWSRLLYDVHPGEVPA